MAQALADDFRRFVMVVDTSNEVAGDADEPHPCIGGARRMQVIIVDEITNAHEVAAARTIANRGVALVGTVHGVSLKTLMLNHELNPLVGGLASATLGDEAAAQRSGGRKTVSERRGAPVFSTVAEVRPSAPAPQHRAQRRRPAVGH